MCKKFSNDIFPFSKFKKNSNAKVRVGIRLRVRVRVKLKKNFFNFEIKKNFFYVLQIFEKIFLAPKTRVRSTGTFFNCFIMTTKSFP